MTAERFPVEAAHITMFARAIGDANPAYDATRAGPNGAAPMVAPPTFPMAAAQFDPDNPLLPRRGEPWFGSGRTAGFTRPGGSGRLHAEQIFEYERPVRAGDVLTGTARTGREWAKQSRSGAVLRFDEAVTEYRDQHGELVVTVTMVRVLTERPAPKEQ